MNQEEAREDLVIQEKVNMKTKFKLILILTIAFLANGFSQSTDDFNYEFALIEAARQKTIGNINESIKLYQKCLAENPESAVVYYELGSIYIALNQPDISEKFLLKAYELENSNYWYVLAYSQILDYQKEYNELLKVLKDYLEVDNNLKITYTLANTFHKLGKERKALRILEKMERDYGVSEQVLLKKVEILKKQNKFLKGEDEIGKLLDLFPEAPEYHIIMAEFLEETGQIQKAIDFYQKAYQLDSMNLYAITNLADYYTEKGEMNQALYYINRAFTLEEVKLEKKMSSLVFFLSRKELLHEHKERFKDILNTLLNLYSENFEIAAIAYDFYMEIEDYERAYGVIKTLLENKKDNYLLWQQAIYTASLLEKYDDMIMLGEEAITIFPNKGQLKLFSGIAYFQKEKYQDSYKLLLEGYENGYEPGEQIQYLTFLAESAYKLGKVQKAFYYFEELLLLEPDNHLAMNNYSYYMALEGSTLERAEELSLKTIMANPENPTYLDTYAWVLFKLKRYEEAYDFIKKAISKEVEDPDIYFHYAWILCQNGENELAGQYFKKARDLGYNDDKKIEKGLNCCKE